MDDDHVKLVRIDDGVRAKLVCEVCGGETYVRLIGETAGTVAAALAYAAANHTH